MSRIVIHGQGAVSPAGWGVPALRAALEKGETLPTMTLARPGWGRTLPCRQVPPPPMRPSFLAHPRLRRANPLAHHVVAASLEALADDTARVQSGSLRLGIIVCTMAGCVTYSRRFYEETLKDPATASPLIFPETVFNAPASHLAAYLGDGAINYTLVGDDGTFLQGLALAAQWLLDGRVDGCIVAGGEELDWIVADALRLFDHRTIHTAGAGALYLKASESVTGSQVNPLPELDLITDSFLFTQGQGRSEAARRMRIQLPDAGLKRLLCLSAQGVPRADAAEESAWSDWSGSRIAPRKILGEAFNAAAAWQCVWACDALRRGESSTSIVSVVGANQQAIGARFVRPDQQNMT